MAAKSFVVLGLGKFGRSVAECLYKNGCDVIGVDIDEERVADVTDRVTYAVKANAADPELYKNLGLGNVDGAVVTLAGHMEASILATILAKEANIPYVISKAVSETHAKVLTKVGADQIVFPEQEMGSRIARNMVFGKFVDTFELSETYSMVEMKVPDAWAGKSLRELSVRSRFGINVIALRRKDEIITNMDPDEKLFSGEIILVVGDNENLGKLNK